MGIPLIISTTSSAFERQCIDSAITTVGELARFMPDQENASNPISLVVKDEIKAFSSVNRLNSSFQFFGDSSTLLSLSKKKLVPHKVTQSITTTEAVQVVAAQVFSSSMLSIPDPRSA